LEKAIADEDDLSLKVLKAFAGLIVIVIPFSVFVFLLGTFLLVDTSDFE
jgi:hypothetical protein